MGLDIYLHWKNQTEAEKKAQFTGFQTSIKAGYLRSSYNALGLNCWLKVNLDTSLESTFQPPSVIGDGGFMPDWDDCLERAEAIWVAARELKESFVILFLRTPSNVASVEDIAEKQDWENYQKIVAFRWVKKPFGLGIELKSPLSPKDHADYLKEVIELVAFCKIGKRRRAKIIWDN